MIINTFLFMYVLATCMTSLEKKKKCLLRSFSHLKFRLFAFLLLNGRSSLYILEINSLSDLWFSNTFSHSGGCLFILWMVSLALKKLPVSFWLHVTLLQSHISVIQGCLSDRRIQQMGIYICWAHSSDSSCVPAVLFWSQQRGKHRCGGTRFTLAGAEGKLWEGSLESVSFDLKFVGGMGIS